MLHLGLGRNSVLFAFDQKEEVFRPVREGLRISGCTAGTMSGVIETFAGCGANIKKLESFSQHAYKDTR